jgi:dTDP-4-dehydrorhamnose 3,5-epimerase
MRDASTVPSSRAVLPHGAALRPLHSEISETGSTLDLFDVSWQAHPDPLVYSHVFTVLPGRAKGWGRHERHDDRYALLAGSVEVALCDTRLDSPTYGLGALVQIHEAARHLLIIPRGVWHATRNVGAAEALIVDFPTEPYDHVQPDKFTLPLDTDELPLQLGAAWVGF